jgi:hypothetical protein
LIYLVFLDSFLYLHQRPSLFLYTNIKCASFVMEKK